MVQRGIFRYRNREEVTSNNTSGVLGEGGQRRAKGDNLKLLNATYRSFFIAFFFIPTLYKL